MKRMDVKNAFSLALATAFLMLALKGLAQLMPVSSGTNFSTVVYCDPPYEQQVKARLSGAEMVSLPGTFIRRQKGEN